MKKTLLSLAAACMALTSTSAMAATDLVKHGPFTVSLLDDDSTCALSAANDTAALMVSFNAPATTLLISVANKGISFRNGATYNVVIDVDGTANTWVGKGVATSSGVSFVQMTAGDAQNTALALYDANEVSFQLTDGTEIASIYSDDDFEQSLVDTVKCSNLANGAE